MVCKKYYLDVLIKELSFTDMYQEVKSECVSLVAEQLEYMMRNQIDVPSEHEKLPSFSGYQSFTKYHWVLGSLQPLINAPQSSSRPYLLVLRPYVYIIKNTVRVHIDLLE